MVSQDPCPEPPLSYSPAALLARVRQRRKPARKCVPVAISGFSAVTSIYEPLDRSGEQAGAGVAEARLPARIVLLAGEALVDLAWTGGPRFLVVVIVGRAECGRRHGIGQVPFDPERLDLAGLPRPLETGA